jgi:Photosynthetic reaction centre cytochrome C subunit
LSAAQRPVAMLGLALTLSSLSAAGQASSGEEALSIPDPVNLKILPKGISKHDLIEVMKQYKADLGVKCSYCHAEEPMTHKLDFASDAKPRKRTTRIMMTMTTELNAKYISNLPTGSDMRVTCGSCHRGHGIPEEFVPPADQSEKH